MGKEINNKKWNFLPLQGEEQHSRGWIWKICGPPSTSLKGTNINEDRKTNINEDRKTNINENRQDKNNKNEMNKELKIELEKEIEKIELEKEKEIKNIEDIKIEKENEIINNNLMNKERQI